MKKVFINFMVFLFVVIVSMWINGSIIEALEKRPPTKSETDYFFMLYKIIFGHGWYGIAVIGQVILSYVFLYYKRFFYGLWFLFCSILVGTYMVNNYSLIAVLLIATIPISFPLLVVFSLASASFKKAK